MATIIDKLFSYMGQLSDDAALEDMVFEHYAPEAYFADPVQKAQGRKEVLRMYRNLGRMFPDISIAILRQLDRDDCVVAEWEMTFKSKYWPVTIPLRGTTWLTLDNQGRILDHRDYWDLVAFLKAGIPLPDTPEPVQRLLNRLRDRT